MSTRKHYLLWSVVTAAAFSISPALAQRSAQPAAPPGMILNQPPMPRTNDPGIPVQKSGDRSFFINETGILKSKEPPPPCPPHCPKGPLGN